MGDEIKEILKEVNKIIDNTAYNEEYSYFEVSHISKLLDLIINSQEEIKRQEDNYKVMQEDIVEVGKLLGLGDEFIISEEMPEKIKELQDYKSRCEKASELIHDIYFRIDFNNLCHPTWVGIKLDETSQGNDLLNILQGSDKE